MLARASNRFVTFVHAMSRTNATAPSSTSSAGLTLPTIDSLREVTLPPMFWLVSGYCRSSARDAPDLGTCGVGGDAGPQSSDDSQEMGRAVEPLRRVAAESEWHPQ